MDWKPLLPFLILWLEKWLKKTLLKWNFNEFENNCIKKSYMKLLMCLFVLVVLANSSTLDTYYNPKWRKTRGMNEANSSQVTSIYILYEVNVYEMETNGYHYIYIYIYIKREIWHIILWFIIVFYIKEKLLNLVMINIQFNYYQLLYHYCNDLINYINV